MPSCEELPSLKNLAETVKQNKINEWDASDRSSESQVTVFFSLVNFRTNKYELCLLDTVDAVAQTKSIQCSPTETRCR